MDFLGNDENSGTVQPLQSTNDKQRQPKHLLLKEDEAANGYLKRAQDFKDRTRQVQKVERERFGASARNIEHLLLNATPKPICQGFQDKVLKCYEENPQRILNCSKLVDAFTSCVNNAKIDVAFTDIIEEKMLLSFLETTDANGLTSDDTESLLRTFHSENGIKHIFLKYLRSVKDYETLQKKKKKSLPIAKR